MSRLDKLIVEETEASERNSDAPIPDGAEITRPNRGRSSVYSIRLNNDEVSAVRELAGAAGVPASTLVRSWIIERVRAEQGEVGDAETELRAVQLHLTHLQRYLSRDVS